MLNLKDRKLTLVLTGELHQPSNWEQIRLVNIRLHDSLFFGWGHIGRKYYWSKMGKLLVKDDWPKRFIKFCMHFATQHIHRKSLPLFYFCVWTCFWCLDVFPVLGGVPLVFGGVASMNVFRPMCRNCNTFIKNQYKGFGSAPFVFVGVAIISMNVFQPMCCTNTAPVPAAI